EAPPPSEGSAEPSPAERAAVESALGEARSLRKARRYAEAIGVLEKTLAARPPAGLAAKLLYARGEIEFREGQDARAKEAHAEAEAAFARALATLDEVVRRYPREETAPSAAYLRGSSYLMLDDVRSARDAYRLAFDRYPGADVQAQALLRVGVCQAGLGDTADATATFRRLLAEFREPKYASQTSKAAKYLRELGLVGMRAPPIAADRWLQGLAAPEGIETFSGDVVLLVFFATWCENCAEEIPHLRHLIARWGGAGAVFLGVANPDDPKNPLSPEAYVEKNGLRFHDVALDAGGKSWTAYRVDSLPAAAVIDRKGTIRWRGHPAFFPGPVVATCLAER
ncbi:MAG: redoxin domain-containing protein, partial [Planctomycetota bacterium]